MKVFWGYITAILLGIANAAVDVEKTVQQVQSILKANTLLPRLTREEIIGLLNDIKAEDAKSYSASKEKINDVFLTTVAQKLGDFTTPTNYKNNQENEINSILKPVGFNRQQIPTIPSKTMESTTKSSGSTLTVVLPYTPRDGSSLQELYTKPPRVQVVAERVTPTPIKPSKVKQEQKNNGKQKKPELDLPAELQAFLDAHGLKGAAGQDNFLLPLEGFKPLPPAKIIDGNVQLPENLLLSYDLISSSESKDNIVSQASFLYEPLRPENPFELDTASSESKHTVLPLDLPKPRKTKAISQTVGIPKPNYEPIDYDAVKVIPLPQGPNPTEDEVVLNVTKPEQSKRQTNETNKSDDISTTTTIEPTNIETNAKVSTAAVSDDVVADSDTGASFADLEDSFGGAAPAEPGDSELPPPKKNGFYWMVDWNSFLEVGDGDTKVNIRFEPKLGDPQMFLPVNVP